MAKATTSVSIDDAPQTNVPAPVVDEVIGSVVAKAVDTDLSGERRWITVHEGAGDDGKLPVSVQVKGVAYQIPRGVRVPAPVEVIHVLNNAVVTHYQSRPGGQTEERNVPRFPFSDHGAVEKKAA